MRQVCRVRVFFFNENMHAELASINDEERNASPQSNLSAPSSVASSLSRRTESLSPPPIGPLSCNGIIEVSDKEYDDDVIPPMRRQKPTSLRYVQLLQPLFVYLKMRQSNYLDDRKATA